MHSILPPKSKQNVTLGVPHSLDGVQGLFGCRWQSVTWWTSRRSCWHLTAGTTRITGNLHESGSRDAVQDCNESVQKNVALDAQAD